MNHFNQKGAISMETITYTTFKKRKIKIRKVVQINPYFSFENWSAKTVYLSPDVNDITTITYRRRPEYILVPFHTDVKTSLEPYYEDLTQILQVVSPVISVFNVTGEKITALHEPEKENKTNKNN